MAGNIQRVFIPFGQFTPDLKNYAHEGLVTCRDLVPVHGSYLTAPTWDQKGTAWSSTGNTNTRGLHAHSLGFDSWMAYLGDVTKLYKIDPASAYAKTDISRTVGGAYNVAGSGGENGWQFTSFGQNVVATDYVDAVQALLPGATNFVDMVTSGVSGAAGMTPKAKFVASLRQNLFLGNLNLAAPFDTLPTGASPSALAWSQSDNIRAYGSPTVTPEYVGAGYQELGNDFGVITGMVGAGEFIVVFQQRGMTLIEGPPYQFTPIVRGVGTRFPNSIAMVDRNVYFWGPAGPSVLRNGVDFQVLGTGRITRTLIDNRTRFSLDAILPSIDIKYVSCAVDTANTLVMWGLTSAPPGDSATSQGNLVVYYNYVEDRFSLSSAQPDAAEPGGILYLRNKPASEESWLPHRDAIGVIGNSITNVQNLALPTYNLGLLVPAIARAYHQLDANRVTRVRRARLIYSLPAAGPFWVTLRLNHANRPYDQPTTTGPYQSSAANSTDVQGWITTPAAKFSDFVQALWEIEGANGAATYNMTELKGYELEYELGGAYAG